MEELALFAVAAVLIIVVVSLFASRLGIAAPILLVAVGIGCSLVPGAPQVVVQPEWILMIVLPPILYAAAVNIPVTDFRRDIRTIGALSVVLVVVSAFATGLLIWWLIPDINFAAAVALGAVISPPDAVAATSIGKKLGLPTRLVTILEGEGLVNDATALVMLRTAVAGIAGTVTFWGAIGDFAYAVVIGVIVGTIIGVVTVWARSLIQQQPVLTTAISLTVPFLAFIPAEELHASGVIAVVVAGLVTGSQATKRFSARDRISERTNWRTIQLLLESGLFLLMGFEITTIVADVQSAGQSIGTAIGIALAATVLLVVVRVAFVTPLIAILRARQPHAAERARLINSALDTPAIVDALHPKKTALLQRRRADAHFLATQGLGWQGGAVLAWSGMRGAITLAAAQSLPQNVPHRAELILIAFTVAIVTLVVQGGTLPWLIDKLGVKGDDTERQRRETERLAQEIIAARKDFLTSPSLRRESGQPFDPLVIEKIRQRSIATSDAFSAMVHDTGEDSPAQQHVEIRRLLVDVEQNVLIEARSSGTYSSRTLERAQHFIDSEAARLT